MGPASLRPLVALSLAVLSCGQAFAGEEAPLVWRALGAVAHGYSFSTGLSGKKATKSEAIESMRSICNEAKERCALVATFNTGCRFVALGGKPMGPKVFAPVFVVGTTAEDAQQRCSKLGLECKREPQGGCLD